MLTNGTPPLHPPHHPLLHAHAHMGFSIAVRTVTVKMHSHTSYSNAVKYLITIAYKN